eukprot:1118013-Karenia_brevis.AAC.1
MTKGQAMGKASGNNEEGCDDDDHNVAWGAAACPCGMPPEPGGKGAVVSPSDCNAHSHDGNALGAKGMGAQHVHREEDHDDGRCDGDDDDGSTWLGREHTGSTGDDDEGGEADEDPMEPTGLG